MPGELPSAALHAALRSTVEAVRAAGARPVLFGGLAVNHRGRARFTKDVDIALELPEDRWPVFLAEIAARGARIPENALERMRRDAMLPVFFGPVRADLLLVADDFTSAIVRDAPQETAFGLEVGVALAEDLLAMKLIAQRPQDIADIQALLVANQGRLDLGRIRRWLPDVEMYHPGSAARFEEWKREFYDPLPPAAPSA